MNNKTAKVTEAIRELKSSFFYFKERVIFMDRWDRITGFCCATCMYFSPKKDLMGRCRRKAPTMAGYPVVYADSDWCGEHKIGTNPDKAKAEAVRPAE
jgi:hypothetical protein